MNRVFWALYVLAWVVVIVGTVLGVAVEGPGSVGDALVLAGVEMGFALGIATLIVKV